MLAACLAALALRVMVPVGWMPAPAANGFALSLCSGTSTPGDPMLPQGDSAPCDYAVAIGPELPSAALLLLLLAPAMLPLPVPLPAPAILRRHRPRPPGQGPPRA